MTERGRGMVVLPRERRAGVHAGLMGEDVDSRFRGNDGWRDFFAGGGFLPISAFVVFGEPGLDRGKIVAMAAADVIKAALQRIIFPYSCKGGSLWKMQSSHSYSTW